ncbi:glycosyltransferase family 117 protein [Saccharicrinis sp. GN24d3]|uniref:glycosyltransferase family 117 protein n=1 Tax=Saccharicrinis sp. GN24d3 TaxID=3458416 RepID=UPI004036F6C5
MERSYLLNSWIKRIAGVFVFVISLAIYLVTLSPTLNFWDCGEFIACANGLEIGHAPGAPLYLMVARIFSLFVASHQVAYSLNILSAIASSLTVWLLYATTIIILNKVTSRINSYRIIFSAVVTSLAFAFTDTFWFSAVEAEVYAISLLFTAFTIWAVLRWENSLPDPNAHRWLLLIAFSMGLSVGVHLLNLLVIPVVVYWVFVKLMDVKYKHIWGFLVGITLLLAIQFLIIHNGLFLAKKLELLFVNIFHLPVHAGLITFMALFFGVLLCGIILTGKKHTVLHFIFVASFFFALGTTSYTMVIVRANAQTAINLNNPSHVFSLESFINRKQYGERPLIKGAWFGAKSTGIASTFNYRLDENGNYERFAEDDRYVYPSGDKSFLQRMYSSQKHHISGYHFWSGSEDGEKPTFFHQLQYLFKYQLGHMYFRYFLWNFSGRQNHYQGHGDFLNGNFTTGFKFIDQQFLGDRQYLHTKELSSATGNNYLMIPLLFGIAGFLFLIRKRHWPLLYLLGSLFILTGAAIAFYLNQPPFEPRERDYVYVGSFYAFSVFIGLGIWDLLQKLKQLSPSKLTDAIASFAILLALPGLLLANNYNDHDRSDRTLARDLAVSYLESCEPNAILFTYGDNDTYPLWYIQEVEGVRKDVRVVNIGLLSADWYIYQQTIARDEAKPLNFTVPLKRYKKGEMDYAAVVDQQAEWMHLKEGLEFLADTSRSGQLLTNGSNKIDFIPRSFRVADNFSAFLSIEKNYLMKGEIALLDIVATNYPQRPVYFANGTPTTSMLGFDRFIQPYGIVSKLVLDSTKIDTEELYQLFKNKINISIPQRSWWDETCMNAIGISDLQNTGIALANKLIAEGESKKAQTILLKFLPITSLPNFELSTNDIRWTQTLFSADLNKEAIAYLEKITYSAVQNFYFYIYSQQYLGGNMLHYAKEEQDYLKELYNLAKEHSITEIELAIEPYLNAF